MTEESGVCVCVCGKHSEDEGEGEKEGGIQRRELKQSTD